MLKCSIELWRAAEMVIHHHTDPFLHSIVYIKQSISAVLRPFMNRLYVFVYFRCMCSLFQMVVGIFKFWKSAILMLFFITPQQAHAAMCCWLRPDSLKLAARRMSKATMQCGCIRSIWSDPQSVRAEQRIINLKVSKTFF